MRNKAMKTVQKNMAKIIEIIIIIVSIIVIFVGIKTIANASEDKKTNTTTEETVTTDSGFKAVTPLIMSTQTAEAEKTPTVKESHKPTEAPIKTPSAETSETPSVEPSIVPSVTPSEKATQKPIETATPATDTEQEEYISEEELIYSQIYLVKDKIISKIDIETPIEEFIENIEIAKGVTIKIYDGEEEVKEGNIGTGMKIVGSNGQENETSVRGDLTGDGKCEQIELTMMIRNLIKLEGWELTGAKEKAADITQDGQIDLVDISKVINYLVYKEWDYTEITSPDIATIEVKGEKEETAYIGKAEIKIIQAEGKNNAKTTYKISGSKIQEETEIKSGNTITLKGRGTYKITAYTYGKEGNRSRGVNKVIKIIDKAEYAIEYYQQKENGTYKLAEKEIKKGTVETIVMAEEKKYKGYKAIEHEEKKLSGIVEEDGSLVLKVYYGLETYNITYNLNGGEIEEEPWTYTVDTEDKKLPKPTKPGYTFIGWTENDEDEPEVEKEIEKGTTGDKEYTAHWIVNTNTIYKIQHYQEKLSGEYLLAETENKTGTTDTTVTVEPKAYPGYRQEENDEEILSGIVLGDGSLVLKVYYGLETYNITYKLNGGEIEGDTKQYTVDTADIILPKPTKTGYTFIGWTESDEDAPKVEKEIKKGTTGDKEYTAHWVANTNTIYKIQHYQEKLSGEYLLAETENKTGTTDTTVTAKPKAYPGYRQERRNEEKLTGTVNGNGSLVLKIYYGLETYNITYNLNGGEIEGNTKQYTVDTADITLPEPRKTGYTFVGWTGSNGTTANKSVIIRKGNYGNKEYTANWQINTSKITINPNGGKVVVASPTGGRIAEITGSTTYTQNYNTTLTYTTPTKESTTTPTTYKVIYNYNYSGARNDEVETTNNVITGYTFNGWEKSNPFYGELSTTNGTYKFPSEDKVTSTITATYERGIISNTTDPVTLPTPTRDGYTFKGWYTDSACTEINKIEGSRYIPSMKEITLYAKWEKEIYVTLYTDGVLAFTSSDKLLPGKTVDKSFGNIYNQEYEKYEEVPWYYYDCCKKVLTVDIVDKISPKSTRYWFHFLENLTRINNIANLNTSEVTDMMGMFSKCPKLEAIDLSNFNTEKVTDMCAMFEDCSSLTSLDVSSFDTSNVTDMSWMFSFRDESPSGNIVSLDLSNFNTSKVTNMCDMFRNCTSLRNLNLSSFDTRNVEDMQGMFKNCSSLTSLNLSNFVTVKVSKMNIMFLDCSSLTYLNLSSFNTSSVENMSSMFSGCSSLTDININADRFNTSSVTNMSAMFYNCSSLTGINLTKFNTSSVKNMRSMFYNCSSLRGLDLSNFDTSSVENMSWMFGECTNLKTVRVTNLFNTARVTDMSYMFNNCSSMTDLNFTGFKTGMVEDMQYMFSGCSSLTSLNLSRFNTSSVTNMQYMFRRCSVLDVIYVGLEWTTENATKTGMFSGCKVKSVTVV